jgi:hypothetical protein
MSKVTIGSLKKTVRCMISAMHEAAAAKNDARVASLLANLPELIGCLPPRERPGMVAEVRMAVFQIDAKRGTSFSRLAGQ